MRVRARACVRAAVCANVGLGTKCAGDDRSEGERLGFRLL